MNQPTRRTSPLRSLAAFALSALVMGGASTAALAGGVFSPGIRPAMVLQEVPPPDAPTNLAVTAVSHTQVSLSWSDPSGGLADFEVQRRVLDGAFATVGLVPPGITEWTDSTVLPDTTYEYRVSAVVDGVFSEYSATVTANTLSVPPAGLAVTGVTNRQITLSWSDASGGQAEFEIQRRVLYGVFETLATVPAGTTEWADLTVLPETTYEYRVGAVVGGIPSEYSAPVTATTLPTLPPTAPGALVAEVLSATSVSLRWEDRSDSEIEMQVFRGVDGGMPVIVQTLPADSTEWVDLGVTADRDYSYTVRAVGTAGPSGPSAKALASTPATVSFQVLSGKRTDSTKVSGDALDMTLGFAALPGSTLPDPVIAGITLVMGKAGDQALVAVPAGDSGWKERKGVFTWKSPKGSFVRATFVVDSAKGTIRFKASRVNLGPVDAGAVRVWLLCGSDAGSVTEPWVVKKPGTLVY